MPPIIVIGMHRAGTSLLTQILQQSGVFIGNDLDNNNESNFFCELNDWAFFQAGAFWDNPCNMNFLNKKFINDISSNFRKHIDSTKAKKYHNNLRKLSNSSDLWAWKDPRNTFTIEIWKNIFPEAKIIHIYRNPIDVAESLKQREIKFQNQRDSLTKTGIRKKINEFRLVKKRIYAQSLRVKYLQEGIKLWEDYTAKSLLNNENCLHLCYEKLLENPKKYINEIYNYLNINIKNKEIELIAKDINVNRKIAFKNNENLIELYEKIKNTELMKKLEYDKLLK